MNARIQKSALRNSAIYLPLPGENRQLTASTVHCLKQLRRCGFTLDEDALRAFNMLSPEQQGRIMETVNDVMGTTLNWTPLVRGWLEPTGEDRIDHLATAYAQFLRQCGMWTAGVTLPCGHLIPDGTFQLSRYNGCPFCGKPFSHQPGCNYGQGSKLRVLARWTDADLEAKLALLAASPVPLDATQREDLAALLEHGVKLDLSAEIPVKENVMLVANALVERGDFQQAGALMRSPVDVMRFLWFRHTGQIQIVEPKTLVRNDMEANKNRFEPDSFAGRLRAEAKMEELHLHYDRRTCRMVAQWLNAMDISAENACAAMHPKRGMWTRFIRALRLAEYAKKPGFDTLRALLQMWWAQTYPVPQADVNLALTYNNISLASDTLQQNPGLFARNLFALILHQGPEPVIKAFRQVLPRIPLRLILAINSAASFYFSVGNRIVKTITNHRREISPNRYIYKYSDHQLQQIKDQITELTMQRLRLHYSQKPQPGVKVYIDPRLEQAVMPIGDRSDTVQSISTALPGMRFPVDGEAVRIFLNWGEGMKAAPIDLDISAKIIYDDKCVDCSYYSLSPSGAKHSGDIRQIPDDVGTCEYIELELDTLRRERAKYVVFLSSHYSGGTLNVNARAGWMNAKYPMQVSNETGVAYDPSTVQHMVRIAPASLSRTLAFGMLDVEAGEIVWLEMGTDDQGAFSFDTQGVMTLYKKLMSKPSVGRLLRIMAEARGMVLVDSPAEADQAYTNEWAQDIPQLIATLL